MSDPMAVPPLRELRACFEGVIPSVIATADAAGIPNVTYLSSVHVVDDERLALSNQFFSKTARNLTENPRANLIVIDPRNYDQYRLTLEYERTERRGPVFEQLRRDVDAVAALSGMQDVFRLRAADVYRVTALERMLSAAERTGTAPADIFGLGSLDGATAMAHVAEISARLGRCTDLDAVLRVTTDALASLLDYHHSLVLLLDECGTRLYTIASYGYPTEGVGSETQVGEGLIGMAAARATPMRLGSVQQMRKYARTVRRSFEAHAEVEPAREVPLPGLADAQSQIAVPMVALGQVVGVIMVESNVPGAYTDADVALLTAVASIVAGAIELDRAQEREAAEVAVATPHRARPRGRTGEATRVRFFAVDGSVFLDGDYLIKGVAGRVLWLLLRRYSEAGQSDFTNKEVRLDPSLELPEIRDNLESRLILLKRRLDERAAPVRIEKTGRGRFRVVVERSLELDAAG